MLNKTSVVNVPSVFLPIHHASHGPPNIPKKSRRRARKTDPHAYLQITDPRIDIEARILRFVQVSARSNMVRRHQPANQIGDPSVYRPYRGGAFPVSKVNDIAVPSWNDLSSWMKSQVIALCLGEISYAPFTLRLHDELLDEVWLTGVKHQEYIRKRLAKLLMARFGYLPWFTFTIENRSKTGLSNKVLHVHGSIEIPILKLKQTGNGRYSLATEARIGRVGGISAACRLEGHQQVKTILRRVAQIDGTRMRFYMNRDQSRNVRLEDGPTYPIFNDAWVSYCLKNSYRKSRVLASHRTSTSRGLVQEAQRLWQLITTGESAMIEIMQNRLHRHRK